MGTAELARIGPVREQIICGVLYPRCFANEGGRPIAEAIFKGGAVFRQANNARVREFGAASGWGQIRGRLLGNDDGEPMIYCFSTCVDSFRTIAVLQHDPDRLEDLDTTQEDHSRTTGSMAATRSLDEADAEETGADHQTVAGRRSKS